MNAAQEKITRARASLVIGQPFFAAIALRLDTRLDDTCETAWTDGRTMALNPAFVDKLTLDGLKTVVAHEVMHVVSLHPLRRESREHGKWNMAGDYSINQILQDAGFKIPDGGLIDRQYTGLASEDIYARLPQSNQGPGQGQGQGKSDPGGMGEVRDYPDPATAQQAAEEIKIAATQAAQIAKKAGRLPAGLERLIEDLTTPVIPWREVLARFVDEQSRNDYTWQRPNARYLASGFVLPGLQAPHLGRLAVIADTSGSISGEELKGFVSEVADIALQYDGAEISVLWVDSRLAGRQEITGLDDIAALRPKGGGGTDFRPGFEALAQDGDEPAAVIYFTDGECDSYPPPPDWPVLWVLTARNRGFRPPFGEVIHM